MDKALLEKHEEIRNMFANSGRERELCVFNHYLEEKNIHIALDKCNITKGKERTNVAESMFIRVNQIMRKKSIR